MKKLIILWSLVSAVALAQEDQLDKEYRKLKAMIETNETWIKSQRDIQKQSEEKIKRADEELTQLDDLFKNYQTNQEQVLKEVEESIKRVPGVVRLVSRKAKYYRCLKDALTAKKSNFYLPCSQTYPVKLTDNELTRIEKWSSLTELSTEELNMKINKLKFDRELDQSAFKLATTRIESALPQKERFLEDEQKLLMKYEDRKIASENLKFMNCDENSPEISLEEEIPYTGAKFKGPFVGVPRDNQDGVGTCYANTAKNLLVGTSRGEAVASFLDLALLYKQDDGVIASGLDGGFSCHVLEKVQRYGYCPQGFAPLETGESNAYTDNWLGTKDSFLWGQSVMIEYLQKFLDGKEKFKRDNPLMSQKMLAKSQDLINKIKTNPNIILPLPVVRYSIPTPWKLKETYELEKRNFPDATFTSFQNDYNEQYKKFYPSYARAVYEGKKADEIFSIFKEKMKPFIDKYKIGFKMEDWKRTYLIDSEKDYKNPELKSLISSSLEFLKYATDRKTESDLEFLEHCDEEDGSFMTFLAQLNPLMDRLKNENINTDVLFDEKGEFKTPTELMQLAVAPGCLNRSKRQELDHKIICDDGYQTVRDIKGLKLPVEEQQKKLREVVVANLLLGYPMGNTFERHINTIVGMRFNKESKKCEYKIRESQTGVSNWQGEEGIFKKIEALTEVRRK